MLGWLYEHRLLTVEQSVLSAVALFLGVDFLFYWFHRFGHRTNIGWAAHMPHHSTEELNYAVALRASVTQRFFSFFFYWPMALFGFKPEWLIAMVAFHLVLQLLPHTRVVPKLPRFIESWMNTPSHHRVHHARNDVYLDKNYGGFLIIWDKLFGSYADEVEPCAYGVTAPPNTWDPTFINFQVWKQVIADAWNAPRWLDKARVWFMPTGWRPEGVPALPTSGWKRDGEEVKFQSTPFKGAKPYLVLQVALAFPVMLLVTREDAGLSTLERVIVSVVLWAAASAWGAILESKQWGRWLDAARLVAQTGLLASFAASGLLPSAWAAAGAAVGLISVAWVLTLRAPAEVEARGAVQAQA